MINSTEYIRLMSFLRRFDCNSREAATYIECLQMGTGSVQEIARRLNSNRITTHTTIEQLIKKGLLFETRKGKKRLIAAESPDVLTRILQRKSNELKLVEKDLDYISKLLYSIQSHDQNTSNVRIYEGENDFKKVLEETLNSKNSLCIFSSGEAFRGSVSSTYLHEYYKRLGENEVHSRTIASSKYTEVFKEYQGKYNLQIRTSKMLDKFNASCYLWNDHIALVSLQNDRISCVVIQNQEMSEFFRNFLFEIIWKISENGN